MAIEIKRATEDDWTTVREIRLAALQDAPYAFGSTYERERNFDEETWRSRLRNPENPTFLAFEGDSAIGMDGIFAADGELNLVAMWVSPAARGAGVGAALTQAVIDFAARRGAPRVILGVAEGNDQARRLYQRLGFRLTGKQQPLRSDPAHSVLEMVREL